MGSIRPTTSLLIVLLASGCGGGGAPSSGLDHPNGVGGATTDAASIDFGDAAAGSQTCAKTSDCDDHNPCTTDTCALGTGEIHGGHCAHAPVADAAACINAGTDAGTPTVGLPPIDPACMGGGQLMSVYPPYVPLAPRDVPATCTNGFELGDATPGSIYTLQTNKPHGAAAITLDVDFATYLQPDGVVVTGIDGMGHTYTLLDTCRLQTWTMGDPTGGLTRPPDQTIRQFRIQVLQGTTQLKFDFRGVVSPVYLQVLGLCDFDVTSFSQSRSWRAVP